jgi:hypothetical protein
LQLYIPLTNLIQNEPWLWSTLQTDTLQAPKGSSSSRALLFDGDSRPETKGQKSPSNFFCPAKEISTL